MVIRNFYATVLNQGIYGAEAYDIPRIEKVRFDTKYWEQSGLPNAPKAKSAAAKQLENYTKNNVIRYSCRSSGLGLLVRYLCQQCAVCLHADRR